MIDTTRKAIKDFLDSLPKGLRKLPKGENYTVKIRRPWWFRILRFILRLLIALTIILSPFYYYLFHYTGDLKDDQGQLLDLSKLEKADYKKSSMIYGNNEEIIGRFFYENRDTIKSEDIPDIVKYAFMSAEDKRFNSNRPGRV